VTVGRLWLLIRAPRICDRGRWTFNVRHPLKLEEAGGDCIYY
jgi:hypothetical protein